MDIFDSHLLKRTIFINVQSVTEYGDLKDFEAKEPEKYLTWKRMAEKRYKDEIEADVSLNKLYLEKACFLPEFSKIVAITYAIPELTKEGIQSRKLMKIEGENEIELITEFTTMLDVAYSMSHDAKTPIPVLCGHNIIGHDIPLIIKRIIKYRDELGYEDGRHTIPQILKHHLGCKPWESNVLDTINVWKFNGTDFISLNLVADLMDLKKTVRLLPKDEINKMYWTGIEDDSGSTMKEIVLQSMNFTNVTFQLVREIRKL